MTLKLKFIIFIVLIHSVVVGLSFLILKDNKVLFIASELLILVSLIIAWSLFNDLIKPLGRLMTGINAIKDKDFTVKFLKTNELETDTLIDVYNAMIDQLRIEKTQQEAQHYFLEKLVTMSPTGILILDFDEKITDLNPKCLEMLGFERKDALQKSIHSFTNPLLKTIAALKTGDSTTINLSNAKTFKCAKSHFTDRGFPRYFIMIEELTAEILAAEKKAYGKVIRMMAHEVNNSIGAVNSILDTTIQLNEASEMTNDALRIAFERNEHLSLFMRHFADVIRLPAPQLELINLHELIIKTKQLMQFKALENNISIELKLNHSINYNSELNKQISNELALNKPINNELELDKSFSNPEFIIKADAHQLEQVLINVIKNAMEAIRKDGIITIKTIENPRQLLIEDTGCGIGQDIDNQLFTPFFSTKTYGQGIGLTLIREILTAHQFDFALYNSIDENKEKKTVFKIGF